MRQLQRVLCVMGIQQREERKEQRKYFEMTTENFPKLTADQITDLGSSEDIK